jgi:hypothetical protein
MGRLLGVRQRLRNHRLYAWARDIRDGLRYIGTRLHETSSPHRRVISLEPSAPSRGHVLLSYVIDPFLTPGRVLSNAHTNQWESLQIAKTFLDLDYSVDVISWHNYEFVPTKDYAVFIGHRINFDRIAPRLDRRCIKIMHIATAHWLFHMASQYQRHLALQERKGVSLPIQRPLSPNRAIEQADCATILGNEFTLSTYRYAAKPLYPVPISTVTLYPWPETKNFERCRTRFLWFGSDGFVHKGLDLALEAFTEMPDCHLTICGPIDREPDFQRVYSRELYHTPNIETVGWVDVSSSKFLEVTNECIGLIYPSCSEGQCGAVVTCLHTGLIPIISYESGVDVEGFGFLLRHCQIDEIKASIRMVANLPAEELKRRARKAWEFARAHHTRDKFAEEYRRAIAAIIVAHRTSPT